MGKKQNNSSELETQLEQTTVELERVQLRLEEVDAEVEACRDVMEATAWLAQLGASLSWPLISIGGKMVRHCRVRWDDLAVEVESNNGPFPGLLEAARLMRERVERREERTGRSLVTRA